MFVGITVGVEAMDDEDRTRALELINAYKRRKHGLDLTAARLGVLTDPSINTEREDIAKEIQSLQEQLGAINPTNVDGRSLADEISTLAELQKRMLDLFSRERALFSRERAILFSTLHAMLDFHAQTDDAVDELLGMVEQLAGAIYPDFHLDSGPPPNQDPRVAVRVLLGGAALVCAPWSPDRCAARRLSARFLSKYLKNAGIYNASAHSAGGGKDIGNR